MLDEAAVLRRAASHSDGTVALVFATAEFAELLLNWACFALRAGVRWFVLVAMDAALFSTLSKGPMRQHALLLPRVRDGNTTIDKINGERCGVELDSLSHAFGPAPSAH